MVPPYESEIFRSCGLQHCLRASFTLLVLFVLTTRVIIGHSRGGTFPFSYVIWRASGAGSQAWICLGLSYYPKYLSLPPHGELIPFLAFMNNGHSITGLLECEGIKGKEKS